MKNYSDLLQQELTLDPQDWTQIRQLGHRMIDDIMDHLQSIREQPVWREIPEQTKDFLSGELPTQPQDAENIYHEFKKHVFPYSKGNIHPRFWAWVIGTGTPLGVLADMLTSTMNSNVGIGEHSAMYVELQVLRWLKKMLGFPESASGMLVSGGSIANITSLIVARNHQTGNNVRNEGMRGLSGQMVIYYSTETHSCMQKGIEVMGLGANAIRKIPVNPDYTINIDSLRKKIEEDITIGNIPFCVVGNAGTVNTGAIDDLDAILKICREHNLWFHIDGAFGALAKLTPEFSEKLKAIEQADSIAFDLHKWMYMPYEVGCFLVRNAEAHKNSFSLTPNYLLNHDRGLAAGPEPFNSYGMELSRGFKALKVWMSLKEHGIEKYAALIRQNIAQAFYLGELVQQQSQLELLTPVTMNIVCYRFVREGLETDSLNNMNKEIVMRLQEEGIASPSSTILHGKYAIRVANVNHRSKKHDFELLVKETLRLGNEIIKEKY